MLLQRRRQQPLRPRLLAGLQLVLGDEALELGDAPLRVDKLLAEEVERLDVLLRRDHHRVVSREKGAHSSALH